MPFVHETRIGDEYLRKGCIWRAVAIEPYTRKDGSETELAVWQGACVVCGGHKFVKTPVGAGLGNSSSFDLRRCSKCIAAQRRVPEQYRAPPAPFFGVWQRRVLEAVQDLKLTTDSATVQEVVEMALRHAPPPAKGGRDMRVPHARRALELLMHRPQAGLCELDGRISWA